MRGSGIGRVGEGVENGEEATGTFEGVGFASPDATVFSGAFGCPAVPVKEDPVQDEIPSARMQMVISR